MKQIKCISLWGACLALAAWPQLGHAFSLAATWGDLDLNGNGISSDSFDSADPNYSTEGLYDPTKNKDGGDMLMAGYFTNSMLSVGNADVMGHIVFGPDATCSIGVNGSAGSKAWVESGTFGVQPGWASTGWDFYFPDAILPVTSWLPTGLAGSPFGGAGLAPNGISYDHVFLFPGDFEVVGNGTIYVHTNTQVRVKSTVNSFQPSKIYVAGTGANAGKLVTYLTGISAVLRPAHQTQSGNAANLVFFGLPSCTTISCGGSNFAGVIYAPQANLSLPGSGSSASHFFGSSVAKTILVMCHVSFHFDENLRRIFPFENPIFTSRLKNQTVGAGQNVTFSVFATNSFPVSYQWMFRSLGNITNVPIAGATNSNLTITNVSAENRGVYFVTVSNGVMSANSSSALLTVLSPAPVLSQPFSPASGQIQFDVVGIAGSNYVVQASTNCVDWSPMVTNVSPFTFAETNTGSIPARFYRAAFLPY